MRALHALAAFTLFTSGAVFMFAAIALAMPLWLSAALFTAGLAGIATSVGLTARATA